MNRFNNVKEALKELIEDSDVPRNLREKLKNMITYINSTEEHDDLKANKLLQELEELSSDINVPTFIRTQLWSVSSLLEQIK